MIEYNQIDGDIIVYRCAAANEHEHENLAVWQTSEMMTRILHETNSAAYTCFLSGSRNFRYDVYPEYKANRKDMPKPRHYNAVREHLVTEWKAKVTDGIEADDAMGIEQCADPSNSIISSIDKDMLMIPGQHYNFVKKEFRTVSPLEGLRHFYFQLIMGDRSDNIPGYDGKMRIKVPKFLEEYVSLLDEMILEQEMFDMVKGMYVDKEQMLINAKCLWIMRKENDFWQPPESLMEENGPQEDSIRL